MRFRPTAGSFIFSTSMVLACFVACGGGDVRPGAGTVGGEGGLGPETSFNPDGGDKGGGDASHCASLTKDSTETDVDCGGANTCKRCALGKACAAEADCDSSKCVNKLCAICDDAKTNGDETDVDCGGKACGGCTVGKRCKAGTDCRSGECKGDACACPKDMAIVALANGGAYCVDQSEVTKGQYNKFITANIAVTTQSGACLATNNTFVPRGAWPPATSPGVPAATLAFNLGLPVHYVDWCDAVSYCKWAKKELCGTINGGTLPLAQAGDPTKSAWFNACSAQGGQTYPYSGEFSETRCNHDGVGAEGPGPARNAGFGYAVNQDNGVYDVAVSDVTGNITAPAHAGCQGGFTSLYQMSGNVAEWEDSCDGVEATSKCRVRGGSYAEGPGTPQSCAAIRDVQRMPGVPVGGPDPLKDIGFRCCQY